MTSFSGIRVLSSRADGKARESRAVGFGKFILVSFVVLLALGQMLFAQRPVANLAGTVTDPQGAVLPGAAVTVLNQETGLKRELATGGDGHYLFTDLAPGSYSLRVSATGLTVSEVKNIKLEVGRSETVNVTMKLAKAGESVTVSEVAVGSVELVQSEVQDQIESTTVEEIPLNGRNFLELAFLLPGNHTSANFDPTKTNSLEVSSAGSLGRGGNVSVDGGDNNDEVVGGTLSNFPQDSIREFQIATNRYTAEVGRSASSIINIVTKSGTNDIHGSAFIFERNRKLGALAANLKRDCPQGQDCRPPFDRQQYGASVGAPIVKDRAWVFASVENRHQNGALETATRDFANNAIVSGATGAPLRDKLASTRVDVKLSDRDTVYGRYSYNQSVDTSNGSLHGGVGSGSPANIQQSLNRFNSVVANWTHTLGTTKVNSAVFHYDAFLNNIPAYGNDVPTFDVNAPGLGVNPDGRPAEIVFPDLQDGQTYRAPQRTPFNRYQFRDAFDWTVGKHALHMGGEWQNYGSKIIFDLYGSSSIFLTQNFATQDLNGDGAINDLDIPVAAVVMSTTSVRPPASPEERSTYLATYIQDDWRVRQNVTLNLGLRYEHDSSLFGTSDLHKPCPAGAVVPTSPCIWAVTALGLHRSSDPKDISPRVGFAWDPFNNAKTVVRGGVGLYYDRVVLETPLLELLLDGRRLSLAGLSGSVITNGKFAAGTPTLANPYVGDPTSLGLGVNVIANNARHPMVQQYTLGFQQQFANGWLVSADGIHNFGTGFLMGRALRDANNAPVTITDSLTGLSNQVTEIGSYAKTWYDGLLVAVKKAPAKVGPVNYSFTVNYTLSKAFNYSNDDQIPFNTGTQADILMGGNNLRLEKGYASTDERHHLSLFGSLGLPWNFNLAPIWALSSSVPGDPTISIPNVGNARIPTLPRGALAREIKNGKQLNAAIAHYLSLPACPTTPTNAGPFPCNAGAVGLVPGQSEYVDPNAKFGSWFNSFDLRLTKAFKIKEHQQFDMVAESFNLFNRVNWRGFNTNNYFGYNTTVTSSTFNQGTNVAGGYFGSGGARAFQFAARYTF